MTDDADGLARFHALPREAALEALLGCCSSPRWAHAMLARRPYSSACAVLDAADDVLAALPDTEIDLALAGHPRIGERPRSAASAREQAGVAGAPEQVHAALAAGNRAYEQRFGYRYLVCASGRSGSELLALLQDRLRNDADTERQVMRTELAKINRIRLRRLLGEPA
ncbi:2-oxo-4-hydroxy-4-carboxy-5-ureidoimidazoline decarboxylase [Nocardia brasiliensis]|uniref:2-oxo-4-hydroxy-4-carboxy-5-ureidoimidazoline decarboxylase n=1 Tax=Nocardia brasiliensis TaxID=37326 RepID=A0A6G9XZY9_NOCBR|nr:2-oxo-4-hydroxy-4-carboxy-5-ureidoimidazoline decarboxylase [Nocardia brasiliensis]QIS06518.1 2-oxo-4-hydroxy-4-carboxy-5-ureidoimidazoline decarboxylase [Nocardia brasiliensis]